MRLINRNVGLTQEPILNPYCLLHTEDEDRWGISAMGEMTPLSGVGFAAVGSLSEGPSQGEPTLMLWPDAHWG